MDFIIVLGIGAILVATGVITPKPNDEELSEEVKVVKTEEVITPPPEIKPEPAPEPEPEPTPEPEPEPTPEPEPEPALKPEPETETTEKSCVKNNIQRVFFTKSSNNQQIYAIKQSCY